MSGVVCSSTWYSFFCVFLHSLHTTIAILLLLFCRLMNGPFSSQRIFYAIPRSNNHLIVNTQHERLSPFFASRINAAIIFHCCVCVCLFPKRKKEVWHKREPTRKLRGWSISISWDSSYSANVLKRTGKKT